MAMQEDSIWMYEPSFPLAIVGSIVYIILFIGVTYLTCIRYRAWYFTVVVVGAAVEVAGYICRIYSVKNQSELTPFVLTLTLTVLAPVLIAAGNYLLISRLIVHVLPSSRHRIFGMPGRRLTPIFVGFDIFSFMVQGSGSGIASSDNWAGPNADTGRYVLIGGLVLQLVAFSLFLALFGRFHFLANKFAVQTAPGGWRKVVLAVYVSSSMIMVRCVYRVCEFSEGLQGYAFLNEWLFWVFEALPMAIAIGIFCLHHPNRHLGGHLIMPKKGEV